jgi:O-antigen/teichoic acid export membrane protein
VGMVGFILMNADRWIAAQWLSPDRFAQYAFAWTVLLVGQSMQLLVNASVFPLLARRFGASGPASAYRACTWVSCALLLIGALLAVPSWVLLDAAIDRWFPAYQPALELLPLFIMVAVLRLSDFWTSFLIVVGREARLLVLNLVAGVSSAVIWWLWASPHAQSGLSLWQIGVLATMLAAMNYLLTSAAAWHAARN